MKIAVLTPTYPPMISGAALFAQSLAQDMAQRGHQVLVLTASDRPHPYRHSGPNLWIERLGSVRNPYRVGQRFSVWPGPAATQRLADFAPDIIHLHEPFLLAWAGLSFSRKHKVPAIITIHAVPWFVTASFSLRNGIQPTVEQGLWKYAQWTLSRCNGAVAATKCVAEVVFAHTGIFPQVISCGVDLASFTPPDPGSRQLAAWRERLGIPDQAPVILHVGRLDKDKNVERVIRAAEQAVRLTPAHLLVVGDGTQRQYLEQLCTELGIMDRCHFPGFIPQAGGLPAVYQLATVFVTASEMETQGLVLLEAAATGLPLVAVNATCIPEIVHEGENGFLVSPGDVTGMGQRLVSLVSDPALARQLGQESKKLAQAHAIEKTFKAYETYYRDVIQKAAVAQPVPLFLL